MEKHLTVIAVINIALGCIGLAVGTGLFVIIAGAGLISQEPIAIFVTSAVGSALAIFFMVISIPGIIGGLGLLKRKSWSRILMLVLSFFSLLNIPFGTIVGIYTIWALMQDESILMLNQ